MKYTIKFRIWHWLNAIVVLGLLGTVFLRKTFLSYKANAEIIMAKLADLGNEIQLEDAKSIARTIRNVMWEWHLFLGYALAFLLLYRVVLFFIDKSQRDPFSSLSLHKKGVKALYYILYATLFFMTITGFAIYLQQALGLGESTVKLLKESHEAVFIFIMIFVPLHVGGVVVADIKEEHGLISTMINGKKKENF